VTDEGKIVSTIARLDGFETLKGFLAQLADNVSPDPLDKDRIDELVLQSTLVELFRLAGLEDLSECTVVYSDYWVLQEISVEQMGWVAIINSDADSVALYRDKRYKAYWGMAARGTWAVDGLIVEGEQRFSATQRNPNLKKAVR